MNIFYYHTLDLKLSSAQTLQVLNDYIYLSRLGYNVFLLGKYQNIDEFHKIQNMIKNSNVKILNKYHFWKRFFMTKKKLVVTRHYRKLKYILFLKKFLNFINIHEMHEESFYYFFKPDKVTKKEFFDTLNCSSGVIFTNKSQLDFYLQEHKKIDFKYIIAPNGVELSKFINVKFTPNKVITYTGHFNKWKNVEIIFQSLAILPKEFTLKIAGGQNNSDKKYINSLINKYNLVGRVNYIGFVNHNEIPEVLNNSNVLLVPLGDNIQSKYLTSPMKFIEYMATGLPIVTMDYPTIKNLICKRDNIFLSKNNKSDFAKKIILASETKKHEIDSCIKNFDYEKRSLNVNKFFKSFF